MTTPNKLPPPTTQQFLQTDGKQVGWNWADWFNRMAKLLEKASPDDGQNVTAGQIFQQHSLYTTPPADKENILSGQIFGA